MTTDEIQSGAFYNIRDAAGERVVGVVKSFGRRDKPQVLELDSFVAIHAQQTRFVTAPQFAKLALSVHAHATTPPQGLHQ